jgi:hypothetical protein
MQRLMTTCLAPFSTRPARYALILVTRGDFDAREHQLRHEGANPAPMLSAVGFCRIEPLFPKARAPANRRNL